MLTYTKNQLLKLSKAEIIMIARKLKIKNYSRKKKIQLINAVMKAINSASETKQSVDISTSSAVGGASSDSVGSSANQETEHINPEPRFDLGKMPEHPPVKKYSELPDSYGDNRLVILPINPHYAMAYWEFTEEFINAKITENGVDQSQIDWVLRLYRLLDFHDKNAPANELKDYILYGMTKKYYLDIPAPGFKYFLDFGMKDQKGNFYQIARSNTVNIPLPEIRQSGNEEWGMPDGQKFVQVADSGSSSKIWERMVTEKGPSSSGTR